MMVGTRGSEIRKITYASELPMHWQLQSGIGIPPIGLSSNGAPSRFGIDPSDYCVDRNSANAQL